MKGIERIKRTQSFRHRTQTFVQRLRKTFYRWERLLVMLLRGRLFFALGRFVRGKGTLTAVIILVLAVAASNISAQTSDDVFLKGYWHESDEHQRKAVIGYNQDDEAGLALGSDAPVQDAQQLAATVDTKTQKEESATDLGALIADEELLLADTAVNSSQLTGTDFNADITGDTTIYTVQSGDTVESIARAHKLTVDTLLWANELDNPDAIKPGDTLILLSISGIQHTIEKGDTMAGIAKEYKVEEKDIIVFNNLPANGEITVGETITIPGGIKERPAPVVAPVIERRVYTSDVAQTATTVRAGYFARPISGGRRTQGIHRTNAVDLAAPQGTPIYAAAPGTVAIARYGYNGGFGNYVVIAHDNGTKTLYAHAQAGGLRVKAGQKVSRGQLIARVGSTGRSTGPHVHFEVHGARNPF